MKLHRVLRKHWRRCALAASAMVLAGGFFAPTVQMMRPRFEHVVVLDITQSMNVADEMLNGRAVTRLQWAQQALQRAIAGLPCGSKLGWAVFTEHRAYLLFAPLEVCAHRAELRNSLQGISNRMAWSGQSEIAKGLHSGITIVQALPSKPSLVFITDGQEAPPLDPRQRPPFDDKPGDVQGLIVGVGALTPSPIPKSDAAGRPLGFWGADQVQQSGPQAQGRGGSVAGERMRESTDGSANGSSSASPDENKSGDDGALSGAAALGATPGSEHLSALRESYLRLLAAEKGLGFHRLTQPDGLLQTLGSPALARPVLTKVDLRPALAGLALLLLLAAWTPALRQIRP
jgi:mxaL protein